MKSYTSPPRILVPLISLSLLTLSGLHAQTDQGTNPPVATNPQSGFGSNGPGTSGWHHHQGGPGFANLTPAERQQLKSDFEQIKDNPQLVAARQAVQQAQQSLEQTRRTLLLQVDPSVESILGKIHPPHQGQQGANTNTNGSTNGN